MATNAFKSFDYVPHPVEDHLHLRLLALDVVSLDHRWKATDVRSSFWRLYVNQGPGATVVVNRQFYRLAPKLVYLLPAWVPFDCWNEGRFDQFFIHFDLVGWPPALVRELFARPQTLASRHNLVGLSEQIAAILPTRGHNAPEVLGLSKAMVLMALAEIIAEQRSMNRRWELLLRGPSPVAAAIQYVENHIPQEIHNDALAQLCHMSPSHFIRTFRRTLGQTPAQYVRERRVARAAEMLALSQAKIDDVALRCGFPNRFYFTRAFHQVMGVPPAKYRARTL